MMCLKCNDVIDIVEEQSLDVRDAFHPLQYQIVSNLKV
jgi:hypothetical protein